MTFAALEIESQPHCWELASSLGLRAAHALPASGAHVVTIGCGTSHNLAKLYGALREGSGEGHTDAFCASELASTRHYDHVVAFSRTGTTTETLEALERVGPGVAITAVTASPKAPLATVADEVVLVDFADEQAVVSTRYFTSVAVCLRAHLGQDTAPLAEQAALALARPLPGEGQQIRQHTFLGRSWTAALADEATLKLRETAQVWSESHNAMEYRHGPMSVAEKGVLVWCFGPTPKGLEAEVRATGASFVASELDPLAELVGAQRLAVGLAKAKGLDPDHPRNLARSVILDASQGRDEAAS